MSGFGDIVGDNSGVKIYRALLTQTGTDAPVATVLENTLGGTLVWTRSQAGNYVGTLAGAFPDADKIWCNDPVQNNGGDINTFSYLYRQSADAVVLFTTNTVGDTAIDLGNGGNYALRLEILVYP